MSPNDWSAASAPIALSPQTTTRFTSKAAFPQCKSTPKKHVLDTSPKTAQGCERCRKLGFRGRIGIFEILRVTDEIHEHIVQRASARKIRQTAIEQGMNTLMRSGWSHIKNGQTTLEEVMRYAEIENEENNTSEILG